ncbi:jg1322 [Pararge aegeria aegeria]|uniref:Jg1322 protein n=1 Tax=Pararge aegeria aegeria TaxID=348720 RepID=A0A8S4QZM5_9NEOP|nr:jg1322 [Pararge aegeria aegeria]
MDVDKPPDPGESITISQYDSQCPNTAQPSSSRKRVGEYETVESNPKKLISDPTLASPSIQSQYEHPSLSEAPKKYVSDDKGPFIVYVSREVSDPSAGTSIRAINFGQFLHKHKVSSILNDGVKNVGRNKISVEFTSAQSANDFLTNPILEISKFKAFIPTYNITRMGLVRGVPSDWHLDEFVKSIEIPSGCGEILKARRLNRKQVNDSGVTWVPTQSVVVTFRGQVLPVKIYSYHTSLPVETYRLPTIQCVNCCRFGHVKAQCRSSPRCFKCSQFHSGESCSVLLDQVVCILCSGKHLATDRNCPEHSRQQSIKIVMSDENLSYQDASSRFPPVRRSYADLAKEMISSTPFSNRTIPNYTLLPQVPTKSYKQSVFRPPRPRAPMGKGFDRQAHNDITRNCQSSLGNGSALNNDHTYTLSSNDNLIPNLTKSLTTIIEILGQNPLPSNVAQIFVKIASVLSNGFGTSSSVEL